MICCVHSIYFTSENQTAEGCRLSAARLTFLSSCEAFLSLLFLSFLPGVFLNNSSHVIMNFHHTKSYILCFNFCIFFGGTQCGGENNFGLCHLFTFPGFYTIPESWDEATFCKSKEWQKQSNSEHLVLAASGDPVLILFCIAHIDHSTCVTQRISPASLTTLLICFSVPAVFII